MASSPETTDIEGMAAAVVLLRRAWLRVIQAENSCLATGQVCAAKRCGCAAEQSMLIEEEVARAA
jgi:hypothetical protein